MITEKLQEIGDLVAISPVEGHNPAYPYVDYGGKRFSFRALDEEQAAMIADLLSATGTEYTLDAPRRIAGDGLDTATVIIREVIRYDNSPAVLDVLVNGIPQTVEITDGQGSLEIAADSSMVGDVIRIALGEQEVMIHVL